MQRYEFTGRFQLRKLLVHQNNMKLKLPVSKEIYNLFNQFSFISHQEINMKTVNQWLQEYGESHKNETNKTIHWICVPSIFFSICGFLYSIKVPLRIDGHHLNVAMFGLLLVILYYLRLSFSIGIGMLLYGTICLLLCHLIEKYAPVSLWLISLIIFIVAWIGQFYGHKVEGKKPSFLKDIQFLLIGPMWLMSFVYKRAGISI